MIINTLKTQRSFDNSWAVGGLNGIPAGAIVDLGFSADRYLDIYLVSYRVYDKRVCMMFRDSSGNAVGDVDTNIVGVPVALNTSTGILGTVLLGFIPEEAGEYVSSPIKINPELLSVYNNNTDSSVLNISLTVDGSEIASLSAEDDIIVIGADDISISSTGVISRYTATAVGGSIDSLAADSERVIYKINNCTPNSDGVVDLTINKGSSAVLVSVSSNCAVLGKITLDSGLDVLDKHLAPIGSREYSYYPLDDAYAYTQNGVSVMTKTRRTVQNLGGNNAAVIVTGGVIGGATHRTDKIDTTAPVYDSSESCAYDNSESCDL